MSKVNKKNLKSDLLLLITATIWGLSFISQRVGAQLMPPNYFNGIRFALGALSLVPVAYFMTRQARKNNSDYTPVFTLKSLKKEWWVFLLIGSILFLASVLQQIGIKNVEAGKAAFITGLYIVIVPFMGIALKNHTTRNTWIGSFIAIIGLYLLTVNEGFRIEHSDFLILISSFFWAAHIIVIGIFSKKIDVIKISIFQFSIVSIFSFIGAILFETVSLSAIKLTLAPILYSGIFSVGVAFTTQALGQKNAHASEAAIILSMETVIAVIAGWILLGEVLSFRALTGCAFMLTGMILSQIQSKNKALKKGQRL